MENPDMQPSAQNTRRYDLDWLRIIAFGLLILYHIGMLKARTLGPLQNQP